MITSLLTDGNHISFITYDGRGYKKKHMKLNSVLLMRYIKVLFKKVAALDFKI